MAATPGAVAGPAAAAPSAPAVAWSSSLSAALAQARAHHGLVLVDFYTDWCTYCKKLDRETYPDPRVRAALKGSFVPVKLNAEREGAAEAEKFHVRGFPTLLFLNGSGSEETRISGFMPAAPFADALHQIAAAHRALPLLEARHQANPRDVDTAFRLLTIYAGQGRTAKAEGTLRSIAAADPSNRSGKLSIGCLMTGQMYREMGDPARASSQFRSAARVGKSGAEVGSAHLGVAICALMQNDVRAAVPELNSARATPGAPESVRQTAQNLLERIRQSGAAH